MLFDKEGNQVPQQIVIQVGEAFKTILKEVVTHFFLFFLKRGSWLMSNVY